MSEKYTPSVLVENALDDIRRLTPVAGVLTDPEVYQRLVTMYLMEYSEGWSVTRFYLSEQSLQSLSNQAA